MINFDTELDNLAAAIARDAQVNTGDNAPSLSDRVEALKVLTAFYVAKRKHPGDDTDDANEFDFSKGVQPASQDAPHGSITELPARRRRPAAN